MNCKNCGANVPENAMECPFCSSKIEIPTEATVSPVEVQTQVQPQNELMGKEYSFSGNDLVIRGRWGVKHNVTVGEDRLNIQTVPAKKNKIPAIMLEDIMAIQESFHMRTTNIVLAILGLVLGFAGGGFWCFAITAFVLLLYRERKMKIHLRNGNVLTIYSDNKEATNEFINDMRRITKIQ